MSQGEIYLIINQQTGHKFVGQTTRGMNKDWADHILESRKMSPLPLHKDIRKYNTHTFRIKQLEECDTKLLDERQQYWIDKYKSEYNDDTFNTDEEVEELIEVKEDKKDYGFYDINNRGKFGGTKIKGIELKTGMLYEWDNAMDAAEHICGDRNKNSFILTCARKGYHCQGYRVKIEGRGKNVPIAAINKITWQEHHFKCIQDAVKQLPGKPTTNRSGIIRCLKSGLRYTYKGHMWKYL